MASDNTDLGDRMKDLYEAPWTGQTLPGRLPILIRLDGKAFHTLTRGLEKPFDPRLVRVMDMTTAYLCSQVQGAKLAFTQSDEISILVHNYSSHDTQPWFGNNVLKICSISAAMAAAYFAVYFRSEVNPDTSKFPAFDCRCMVMPESEVENYFVWRQMDARRNSVSMLAQAHFSHKELHGKHTGDMKEMLMAKGINWDALPSQVRLGRVFERQTFERNGVMRSCWDALKETPDFVSDREIVRRHFA
jgi:tRNA(His) guanylyltransferase